MKMNKLFAVLMTVLFLAPFFPARGDSAPAFTADEGRLLQGMERSWQQGYEPSVSRDKWNLILPVHSDHAVGTVKAELVIPDGRANPFKPQAMDVTAREEEKGVWGIRFSLALLPDRKNADFPCVIRLTGRDAEGKDLASDIPYTVRFRDCKEDAEKIRIEVSDVQAELSVGEEGEVRLTLTNPCAAAVFEDLELKISDSTGHILPRGAETAALGSLGIGESRTVSYPVTVIEKTSVTPHVLKMDLSWTALGKPATATVNHTVSVHQEIRLEQGGLRMAPSVTAGDSVSLILPLMNMGKADVVNVLATVCLPGVTERQSVLVGTIQPGETKQAQMILSPGRDITGEFAGTLAVECTDQDGNPSSFELPVNLTVDKPVQAEKTVRTADGQRAEKTSSLIWILAAGCGVLLMALLGQGAVLRRKLHMLEEEKL